MGVYDHDNMPSNYETEFTPAVLRYYTPAAECQICKSTSDLQMRNVGDIARSTRCASCWQRAEDESALVLLIDRVKRNPDLTALLRDALGISK